MKRKKPGKKSRKRKQLISQGPDIWLFLCFLIAVFSPSASSAQQAEYPFKSGENVRYGAYYNWHFIWIQSGEVDFSADTLQYQKQTAWHLKATGKTFKAYDVFYTVRDTFETYSNFKTFRPIYSNRVINHARENTVHQYWFDPLSAQVKAQISLAKNKHSRAVFQAPDDTYDLLATAYYFRNIDFSKFFIGQKVPYRMIIDSQVDNLFFRYLGKENIKTRSGPEFRCHKVSVYLLHGDFFPEGENMKIWFTDDRNHLPIQVETEILVGSVKAQLITSTALKYPLTSKIN